jgi:dual specificity phosphatase 12
MKEIRNNGLYIGNREDAFTCLTQDTNITHILTIEAEPLSGTDKYDKGSHDIILKHVQCLDQLQADLLSHLDECIHFIEKGLKNGRVLVHWYRVISLLGEGGD